MTWLNDNAAAIQALSSFVVVAATIVLVFITWRYVKLTKDLVDSASAQVKALERQYEGKRVQVLNLVRTLRGHLKTLPEEVKAGEAIRSATLWEPGDVLLLQVVASEIDFEAGRYAALLGSPLSYLRDRSVEVRETPVKRGFSWGTFDWVRWTESLEAARANLRGVWECVARPADEDWGATGQGPLATPKP
ncbi:hypothetical protein ACFL0I_01125 [Gemmatimonadota bacterium]